MARTSASATSAKVLDDAERQLAIMDWQLFTMEQENKLWGYNENTDWVPGEPIHKHPYDLGREHNDRISEMDSEEFGEAYRAHEENSAADSLFWDGPIGNHVRPMIQEFDIGEDYADSMICQDCEVSWNKYKEDACWNCGKEFPKLKRADPIKIEHIREVALHSVEPMFPLPMFEITDMRMDGHGITADLRLREGLRNEMGENWYALMGEAMRGVSASMREMAPAARQAGRSIRGLTAHMHFHDEGLVTPNEMRAWVGLPTITPYRTSEPPVHLDLFKLPAQRELHIPGRLDHLYDPMGEPARGYLRWDLVPTNWAEQRVAVPLPNMPEPRDWSQWTYEPSYVRLINEQRRQNDRVRVRQRGEHR